MGGGRGREGGAAGARGGEATGEGGGQFVGPPGASSGSLAGKAVCAAIVGKKLDLAAQRRVECAFVRLIRRGQPAGRTSVGGWFEQGCPLCTHHFGSEEREFGSKSENSGLKSENSGLKGTVSGLA